VIDIRRGDMLIEIQTASFGSMGRKFDRLLDRHRMLLVHPIAASTYLERPGKRPRKSPRKGSVYDIFEELVSIPTLLDHPNLTLDVVLVAITKVQEYDDRARRGRGGYRTVDRCLREVHEVHRFRDIDDLARLLPDEIPEPFTTADIATAANVPRDVAQRMAFCFRALEVIESVGRTKAGIEYQYRGRS
jgi:hypothetical protein